MSQLARQISFFAPAAVMSAWAVVMLHTIATGRINQLLSPMFRNYVLAAAALLMVLSALYVLLYQPTTETAPSLAPTGRLRQLGRWLVLLVPIVAAAIFSPSALSSTTMINRGLDPTSGVTPMPSFSDKNNEAVKDALAADPNQAVPMEVTELIALAQQPEQLKGFESREVISVGHYFVSARGTAPKLLRMIMWCCAADAQPAAVELTGNVKGEWKDSDWLEVTGKARFPVRNGHVVPTIEVESIKTTQEPDEPYLSP